MRIMKNLQRKAADLGYTLVSKEKNQENLDPNISMA